MSSKPKYRKTLICLANSRRPGGRCVAGKEVFGGKLGKWLRPVNEHNGQAISETDRQFEDGRMADVFDILSIPMIRPSPHDHHTENHLIAADYYWKRIAQVGWGDIVAALDEVKGPLWPNGDSTFHGINDKVSEDLARGLNFSLLLIKPASLSLIVAAESQFGGGSRRRVRAQFSFDAVQYNFVVTDPWIEAKYFGGKDGHYKISESILCISLSEVLYGAAFKLAATIITPERLDKT